MFTEAQKKYIETFTAEFILEMQFIVGVKRGHATARKTFIEKLADKINLATNLLDVFGYFFPAIKGGASNAKKAIEASGKVFGYFFNKFNRKVNSNIDAVVQGATQPELLLKLMIENIARQLACRYEFFLNHMCDPVSIDFFALIGVARALEYLLDHPELEFHAQNILRGVIEGRSGSGHQGFTNNKLKSRHPERDTIEAEVVYGRSALMNLEGACFCKKAPKITLGKTFGYVELKAGIPIAGVMVLRPHELAEYDYPSLPSSSELQTYLQNYKPGFKDIGREEIFAYLAHIRSDPSRARVTLVEYYGGLELICRDNFESGDDLSGGYFNDVDFGGTDFTDTILTGASFERAYLVGARLLRARADQVNFSHANLSLINATEGIFSKSIFTSAKVQYASFVEAHLEEANYLGADWYGSDFANIYIASEARLELESLQGTLQEILTEQQFQRSLMRQFEVQSMEQERRLDTVADRFAAQDADKIRRIQVLTRQYSELTQSQTELRFELGKLVHTVLGLQAQLRQQVAACSSDTLQDQIHVIETSIHHCQRYLAGLKPDLDKLVHMARRLDVAEGKIDRLTAMTTGLYQEYQTFKAQFQSLSKINERFGHLERQVSHYSQKVDVCLADVETKLTAVLEQPHPSQPIYLVTTSSAALSHVAGASGVFSAPDPIRELGATDPTLLRVYQILSEYSPFPGYPCFIKLPTTHHPELTLRYQMLDTPAHRFIMDMLASKFKLHFVRKKSRPLSGEAPFLELLLTRYDMEELEKYKSLLPRLITLFTEVPKPSRLAATK